MHVMSSKTFIIPLLFFCEHIVTIVYQKRVGPRSLTDYDMMELAIAEALKASHEGEVPVGAVLASAGEVIAKNHNRALSQHDPTAHAEMLVLREGAARIGNYRLNGCDLYVTIEPCLMCAGAIVQSRISRLIFGARDEKGGAVESLYHLLDDPRLNHHVQVREGIHTERCQQILRSFFRARRG
jgi:tRNA(adenine34) deaminase